MLVRKSNLYNQLPEYWHKPIVEINIDGKIYRDDKILDYSITYGNSGTDLSVSIPSASIQIFGKLPIKYNSFISIDVNAGPILLYRKIRRFTGRVATQSIKVLRNGNYVTSINATSSSLGLFRSSAKKVFTGGPGQGHLYDAVQFVISQGTGIRGLSFKSTAELGVMERMAFVDKAKEYAVSDILSLLEKNACAVWHGRDGSLKFVHTESVERSVKEAIKNLRPILKERTLPSVEISQDKGYVDTRVKCQFVRQGTGGRVDEADWSREMFPAGSYPRKTEIIDLTDLAYRDELWNYGYRAALLREYEVKYKIPSISFSLPALAGDTDKYYYRLFNQLLDLEEGSWVAFGAEWDSEITGLLMCKGFTERMTPAGWTIDISLVDARYLFGFTRWRDKLPDPLAFTWEQFAKKAVWNTTSPSWKDIDNGYEI